MQSLKATLVFGVPVGGLNAATDTKVGYARTDAREARESRGPIELDETIDATDVPELAMRMSNPMTTQSRTTVLPRRHKGADGVPLPTNEERPRFDRVRQLGEGGIGTVELARDNDIRRTVAVKKLRDEVRSTGSLLRFADEVRIVGQLEHPNIVPVYDVGRDDAGDVYLVMKHLEGETMEEILEKLRAGDPEYFARFTPEFRAHLFLSVLDAVRYAHSRRVLHRDLKPANIMIGPYDEVTVMDWGIAKPIGRREEEPQAAPAKSWLHSTDQRLLETQLGTLSGTPFYMSPEQAAGQNDSLDERSDVYALSVVFYEWLTLHHPLEGKATLLEALAAIITQDHDPKSLVTRAMDANVPVEYVHLIARGLMRDREARIASAAALYDELKAILEGRIAVVCPVTFAKRVAHEGIRWIDRHPRLFVTLFSAAGLALVAGLGGLVWSVAHAFG